MEKTRSLPPLVRGKVTAVLGLFVDKISVRNISLLMDTFDLVVQVQWWGENLPTYIRPNKSCYQRGTINRNSDSVDINLQYVKYEIMTTLDLFKLYLKATEVLELCILDIVKNCIIGSAFLRDLINVLNKGNHFIKAPIFDYVGEEIGELVLCFCFLDKSNNNSVKKNEVISVHKNNYSERFDIQDFKTSNKTENSSKISTDNNFLNNRTEKVDSGSYTTNYVPLVTKTECKKNEKIDTLHPNQSHVTNSLIMSAKKMCKSDVEIHEDIINTYKCLPEVSTSSDSSKVLHFGMSSQKNRKKICRNKFKSYPVKCKNKSRSNENSTSFPFGNGSYVEESIKNWPISQVIIKNSKEKATKITDIKPYNVPPLDKLSQSEDCDSSHNQTLMKDNLSKQSTETKVLDFLLGSDLSKEDELNAINEFKIMSPSQDLVISLNQLCLTSDTNDSHKSEILHRYYTDSVGSLQLFFDFNNPIERNYYEKFFLNSELSPDLELHEFQNQPVNSPVSEKSKYEDKSIKDSCLFRDFKSRECPLDEEDSQKQKGEENFSKYFNKMNDSAKGCAQCKYYKKLDELDKIIESLKHFETKLHINEEVWSQH